MGEHFAATLAALEQSDRDRRRVEALFKGAGNSLRKQGWDLDTRLMNGEVRRLRRFLDHG